MISSCQDWSKTFECPHIWIFFAKVERNHTTPKMPINLSMTFNYYIQFFQNSQSTLITNIGRSTGIRQVYATLYMNTIATLFSSRSGTIFASWIIGSSSVTESVTNDQRIGSRGDKFFSQFSRVRNYQTEVRILSGKFLSKIPSTPVGGKKQVTYEMSDKLLFLA